MLLSDIKFPKGTRFLVTGGAGFIGSNLCEFLLNSGCEVVCLDDLSNGSEENVALFADNPHYRFIKGDICRRETCFEACEGADYVLHQAAWGSVPRSVKMPAYYEKVNIGGTVNMMDAALKCGVKRFVFASSSSVYGDSEQLPKKEGCEGRVLSPYALTKRVCEEYGRLYLSLYGLKTVGLRYFNVYGRRQRPDGAYAAVIPKFIRQLLRGERPVINGDGGQSRDFTYVDDVVKANLCACLADDASCGKAYNIACGGRVFLNDLYDEIAKILGSDIRPEYAPPSVGDIRHSNADILLAHENLGYTPEFTFSRGILAAADWYKESLADSITK